MLLEEGKNEKGICRNTVIPENTHKTSCKILGDELERHTFVIPLHLGMGCDDSPNHTGLRLVRLVVCLGRSRSHGADDVSGVLSREEAISSNVGACLKKQSV